MSTKHLACHFSQALQAKDFPEKDAAAALLKS